MLFNNNPLFDVEFLKELDRQNNREIYARVISLTFQETPIETIEGRITSGNISIDGASAIRRTCSISMIAKDLDINSFYWGVKTKFKLEIGLTNTIKNISYGKDKDGNILYWGDKYPQDIIWFPQGVYVITSFSTSQSTNNFNISIQGKDKMCLLNGELGGNLPMSVDFSTQEFVDKKTDTIFYEKITIKNIIKEALHAYALEPYHNIIINDLDEAGLELLEYRGEDPIYLLYNVKTNEYINLRRKKDEETIVYLCTKDSNGQYVLLNPSKPDERDGEVTKLNNITHTSRIEKIKDDIADIFVFEVEQDKAQKKWIIPEKAKFYKTAKVEYGQTAGYRITDLIYPGDLISSIGETLTSILDKIKNMLGEFEYFYDLEGRFIFQRKKNYIQQTFNGEVNNDQDRFIENSAYNSQIFYKFEGGNLITSYQNAPNLTNLKNDYSIWGTRKSVNGDEILIHYRYAIDTKPVRYTQIEITQEDVNKLKTLMPNVEFKTRTKNDTTAPATFSIEEYDWREIIYQMALDYYNYNQLDDFTIKIIEANKAKNNDEEDLYITGTTGYERYYMDIQGFWRQLYDPKPNKVYPPIDSFIQKDDVFNLYDNNNNLIMNLYTDFKYVKWTPEAKVDKSEIVVLKRHQLPEQNNEYSRYEFHDLVNAEKISVLFPLENGVEMPSKVYYVCCGISENKEGKKPLTPDVLPYIKKNELFKKIDIDVEKETQAGNFKVSKDESTLTWTYHGTDYEAYYDLIDGVIDKTKAHTYFSLLDCIIKEKYYDKSQKPSWYYKVILPKDEKDLYPFFELAEDGKTINSWPIECDLGYLYFSDYKNKAATKAYSYLLYSYYNFQGVYDSSIDPEKRYIDLYHSDYDYYLYDNKEKQQQKYWNKNVNDAPDLLNFWLDFLEEGELDQFSIQAVGDRTKVVNDKDVKSIYFRDVPEIIFIDMSIEENSQKDLELIDISNYWHFTRIRNVPMNLFSISAQGKSAQDELENLLYNHSYCIESITLQSLPIYYLEPNARIFVRDDSSKINGEYIINRISIPLTYNGTMTINAIKAPTRLY